MKRINLMSDKSTMTHKDMAIMAIVLVVSIGMLFWVARTFYPYEDEIGANGYKSIRIMLDTDCPELTPTIDAFVEQNKKITSDDYRRFHHQCKTFKRDREKRNLTEAMKGIQ